MTVVHDACKENLSIDHVAIRCARYTETRIIFINPTSLQLALNEENTIGIYKLILAVFAKILNNCKYFKSCFSQLVFVCHSCRLITHEAFKLNKK